MSFIQLSIFVILGIVALAASIAAIRTAAVDGYHREPQRVPSR
jgi:hypothetical protein